MRVERNERGSSKQGGEFLSLWDISSEFETRKKRVSASDNLIADYFC
jgi:hypothetical protein